VQRISSQANLFLFFSFFIYSNVEQPSELFPIIGHERRKVDGRKQLFNHKSIGHWYFKEKALSLVIIYILNSSRSIQSGDMVKRRVTMLGRFISIKSKIYNMV
jgi:hypothetical protein